jgi:hypothetical protein
VLGQGQNVPGHIGAEMPLIRNRAPAAEPVSATDLAAGPGDEIAEVRWLTLAEATALMPGMHGPVAIHLVTVLADASR